MDSPERRAHHHGHHPCPPAPHCPPLLPAPPRHQPRELPQFDAAQTLCQNQDPRFPLLNDSTESRHLPRRRSGFLPNLLALVCGSVGDISDVIAQVLISGVSLGDLGVCLLKHREQMVDMVLKDGDPGLLLLGSSRE
jgi:hypothetical protein